MEQNSGLKKTPLYQIHLRYGARLVPFAGWLMPVQYSGILEEHIKVRNFAGIFDVSHMGEVWLEGKQSLEILQQIITNDAGRMKPNQVLYSPMCNHSGGVVDDILVYMFSPERYLLVVNAANLEKDLAWVKQNAVKDVQITDRSAETAQISLQGPSSLDIIRSITDVELEALGYYRFLQGKITGISCLISRTGYTGEDGFEIYLDRAKAEQIWEALMKAGRAMSLAPAGLGARDTLRFEAGLSLYGNELSESISPLEVGLKRFVSFEKDNFIGKDALLAQHRQGPARSLLGFEMLDRGIPRSGYFLFNREGEDIGFVTSGTYAPTLQKNLGFGLVRRHSAGTDELLVKIRNKYLRARVVPRPFYSRK